MIVFNGNLFSARGRAHDRSLGLCHIRNDASGSSTVGRYVVTLRTGPKERITVVDNFPRKSRSGWELLRRALNQLEEAGDLP